MTTQAYDTPSFKQTYQFYRYINANPASALATQFVNAIAAAQSQATEAAATAEIDSFFRNTGIYSAVSLDSFLEMAEWLFTTLPAWAGFANHCSYSVKLNGSNGVADAGKVVLNLTGGKDGDYSATYHALDGSKTPLYYQEGQLVDELAVDNPAIQLQTSFAALGLFTGDPDDAETPLSVLCGTVHGQQSLALPEESDNAGQNSTDSNQSSDLIALVLIGCNVVLFIIYAVQSYKFQKKLDDIPTLSDIQTRYQKNQEESGQLETKPETFIELQENYKTSALKLENDRTRAELIRELQAQNQAEKIIATALGTSPDLETCVRETNENCKELKKINTSDWDASNQLRLLGGKISDTTWNLAPIIDNNLNAFSKSQRQELGIENQASQEVEQQDQQTEEYRDTIEKSE